MDVVLVHLFRCDHCDREFESHLHRIEHKLDVALSQLELVLTTQEDVDAAVTAVKSATDTIIATGTDLVAAAANIQAEIAALVASGAPVDTTALNDSVTALNAALQPLKDARAEVDALETPAPPAG
jgi:hypothetical protein